MQISEAAGGNPETGTEPCRFPKLEECAHFHYERVQLPKLTAVLQTTMDQSLHSQHTANEESAEWFMVQVTSGEECWLVQRNFNNFLMLDEQLHQCIYDRKISQLPDISCISPNTEDLESILVSYLEKLSEIADNTINCGPVLNWLQMDNKGHRLLVPSEESRSINTPAVAAAYSVRRYVSQARDELNLEVGDMISVIDMAKPGESLWWRGKRGFQVGFFPQHCVHVIGDKVPRNMPLPPPVVGSLALSPIKPVLRKHGKLIAFFRSFILNRPSRRKLKQSGILKERVFGCDLGEHLLNSGQDIPKVLTCCAEFIEKHGIVDGIYRLSGVTSNIQKLRNAFDEDRVPNLYTEEILQDIHSVASLLKMYFRELPNPLCTYQLYQSFVNAVEGCSISSRNSESDRERLLKMREAVQKLPPPHYRTLEYLMRHLAKVATFGSSTGMTTRNVAIVWAPNLLRCEELEVGGVAALQGVGVQAVVTEFLICYADLIFCDHLPSLDHPSVNMDLSLLQKQTRPKSLAISTPTKLITLEEARSKHMLNKGEECTYIEVGGGPSNLPKKYHTIIDLPPGTRKRGHSKRSPLGWRSFFTKSRNTSQGALVKNRKASTPGIKVAEKSVTESDLTDMKRKLRTVKSAESLTSGHSEPASNEIDGLAPLHCLNKPPGHNRSVSHDSYFDTLQSSQNNSEGSLLDLSEIQLNFELEESEMRIFSEDESLVSSPRIQKDSCHRRILTRARPEEYGSATNSSNASPKKQPRVVLSPESMSRKRSRLEDQLSDIQYIDCNTPDNNPTTISTTAVVHSVPETQKSDIEQTELYQPRNKSPRNSNIVTIAADSYEITSDGLIMRTSAEDKLKRQSLNFDKPVASAIPKSFTEADIGGKVTVVQCGGMTPTPQSPNYKQLVESSNATTPGITPDISPGDIKGNKAVIENLQKQYEVVVSPTEKPPKSPVYENVTTTINIIYKSPTKVARSPTSPVEQSKKHKDAIFKETENAEHAVVPTWSANLPAQEAAVPPVLHKKKSSPNYESKQAASQPNLLKDGEENGHLTIPAESEQRPKSLNDLDDLNKKSLKKNIDNQNDSTNAIFNSVSHVNTDLTDKLNSELTVCNSDSFLESSMTQKIGSQNTLSSSRSSDLNNRIQPAVHGAPYHCIENIESPSDFSLSEVVNSSTENLNTSSISFPSPTQNSASPNVSPTQLIESSDSISHNDSLLSSAREVGERVRQDSQSSLLGENIIPEEMHVEHIFHPRKSIDTTVKGEKSLLEDNSFQGDNSITESETTYSSENKSDLTFFNISEIPSVSEDPKYRLPLNQNQLKIEPITENLIEFSPLVEHVDLEKSLSDKRKSCETEETIDENSIYQQVKYFRRSIHEVNALLDLEKESQNEDSDKMLEDSLCSQNTESHTSQISAIESLEKQSSLDKGSVDNFNLPVDNTHLEGCQIEESLSNSPSHMSKGRKSDSREHIEPNVIIIGNSESNSDSFSKNEILYENQSFTKIRNTSSERTKPQNVDILETKEASNVSTQSSQSIFMNNSKTNEVLNTPSLTDTLSYDKHGNTIISLNQDDTKLSSTLEADDDVYENVIVSRSSQKCISKIAQREPTKILETHASTAFASIASEIPTETNDYQQKICDKALRKVPDIDDRQADIEFETYDSLETEDLHVYENFDSSMPCEDVLDNVYENVDCKSGSWKKEEITTDLDSISISASEKLPPIKPIHSIKKIHKDKTALSDISSPEQSMDISIHSEETSNFIRSKTSDKIETSRKSVKSLTNKFEQPSKKVEDVPLRNVSSKSSEIRSLSRLSNDDLKHKKSTDSLPRSAGKKTYNDRDSLPPCLRARNLKHSIKTRSLDEEEFKREFGMGSLQRRKSLEEVVAYKVNTLPKTLNQPKKLPASEEKLDFHLTHSTESMLSEQKLNRERIEKYKEERRKFLHDKYRSESFKEDKDVLLSRLKVYKPKEDDKLRLPKSERRKNSGSDDVKEGSEDFSSDSLEPLEVIENKSSLTMKSPHVPVVEKNDTTDDRVTINPRESLRMRAAKFESPSAIPVPRVNKVIKSDTSKSDKVKGQSFDAKKAICDDRKSETLSDIVSVDFLRNRNKDDDILKNERRRRTYESTTNREREIDTDRFRRTSLDTRSPRKEKTSPSYCIKDMKAIFESKSQQ